MITTSRPPNYRWKPDDDLVALYISRHGCRFLPMMQAGVTRILGVKEGSFGMRQDNFAYLDGQQGLSQPSRAVTGNPPTIWEPKRTRVALARVLQVLEERKARR